MEIKYNYEVKDDKVFIYDIDIDLENTLFSGQAFRWKLDGKGYFGVCYNQSIYAYKENNTLVLENVDEDFFYNNMADYFDLYKDYKKIIADFKSDKILEKSLAYAPGIRVLNQEPFETTISFIISANNNIKRIRSIIKNLSKKYGEKKECFDNAYYTFPMPKALADATEQDLKECGAGYRASYIKETATKIANGFNFDDIKKMTYLEARKRLTEFKGVGNKVADCILLYSLGFSNAFPLDVWIKRVVHNLYEFESVKDEDILKFADERFGEYAGIAQQYLFYYVKENKLGIE